MKRRENKGRSFCFYFTENWNSLGKHQSPRFPISICDGAFEIEIRFQQTKSQNFLKGSRNLKSHKCLAWWMDDGRLRLVLENLHKQTETPHRGKNHYINCEMCPPRRKIGFACLLNYLHSVFIIYRTFA